MSTHVIPSQAQHIKRLRVFSGPNGSGKSSVLEAITERFCAGVTVNADALQRKLELSAGVTLQSYLPSLTGEDFLAYYNGHPLRAHEGTPYPFVALEDGRLRLSEVGASSLKPSCAAAILADYLLTKLVEAGEDISFEAAFPHLSELDLMRRAKASGYRVYLYYICVASPEISKQRVALRVTQGGVGVPDAKVVEHYERSLASLKDAVALSDKAYLFDNTYSGASLKLEINRASEVIVHETRLPDWITRHVAALIPSPV